MWCDENSGKRRNGIRTDAMPNQSKNQFVISNQFTPENSALVLIDYQVGTLQFIHNMSPDESLQNAVMLAKAARAYGMPRGSHIQPGRSYSRADCARVAGSFAGGIQEPN